MAFFHKLIFERAQYASRPACYRCSPGKVSRGTVRGRHLVSEDMGARSAGAYRLFAGIDRAAAGHTSLDPRSLPLGPLGSFVVEICRDRGRAGDFPAAPGLPQAVSAARIMFIRPN